MFRNTFIVTGAAAVVGLAGVCAAQQAGTMETAKEEIKPLTIGDNARDIDIAHWVKPGELADARGKFTPITTFEKDKVYVLEFWATWCGPCVASMPHMSELQEKYADYDVTFIGVSDEPLATVVSFLFKEYKADGKIHNDRAQYTLTCDPDNSTHRDYFKAAGQNGIPCAFIIGKDSKVEWIGHPMTIDEPLDKIVRDNWDRDTFKANWEKEAAAEREMMAMQQKYYAAIQTGDFETALGLLNTAPENHPESTEIQFQKFMLLASQMDKPKEAYVLAGQIGEQNWDNSMMLNRIAWIIVDQPGIKTRDLDLSLKLALRANELTNDKDAAVLDTVGRVYFEKGDLKNAIKYQTKAVEFASEGPMAEDIKASLEKYKAAQKK